MVRSSIRAPELEFLGRHETRRAEHPAHRVRERPARIHIEIDHAQLLRCEVVHQAAVVEVHGDPASIRELDVQLIDRRQCRRDRERGQGAKPREARRRIVATRTRHAEQLAVEPVVDEQRARLAIRSHDRARVVRGACSYRQSRPRCAAMPRVRVVGLVDATSCLHEVQTLADADAIRDVARVLCVERGEHFAGQHELMLHVSVYATSPRSASVLTLLSAMAGWGPHVRGRAGTRLRSEVGSLRTISRTGPPARSASCWNASADK